MSFYVKISTDRRLLDVTYRWTEILFSKKNLRMIDSEQAEH
jgi:hypothetical protein